MTVAVIYPEGIEEVDARAGVGAITGTGAGVGKILSVGVETVV